MAKDEAMLKAFRAGEDIHATTAAAIYDIELNKVTKEMRRHAKAINFGLIYGMSAFGLARSTDLTLAEAEDFVKAYFTKFPGVKKYLDGIRRQAAEHRLCGNTARTQKIFPRFARQDQCPDEEPRRTRSHQRSHSRHCRGYYEDRHAQDSIRAQSRWLKSQMLLQVHDELVLECPKDELEKTARLVQKTMANAYPMSIPLSNRSTRGRKVGAR